jgi:hypothetical protein
VRIAACRQARYNLVIVHNTWINGLPLPLRSAVRAAEVARFSYGLRVLRTPAHQVVLLLGETHVKGLPAARIGRELVHQFALRGVETFQVRKGLLGRALWVTVMLPRIALRALSFGWICDSTIVDAKNAKAGTTVEIEKNAAGESLPLSVRVAAAYLATFFGIAFVYFACHMLADIEWSGQLWMARIAEILNYIVGAMQVHMLLLPLAWWLRAKPWAPLVHPLIAILSVRDTIMARGIDRMMKAHLDAPHALVIVGRAHLPGLVQTLTHEYNYQQVPER